MTNAAKTETTCYTLIALMVLAALLAFAPGCGDNAPTEPATPPQVSSTGSAPPADASHDPVLVGCWQEAVPGGYRTHVYNADGTCALDGGSNPCTWTTQDGIVTMVFRNFTLIFSSYSVDDGTLTQTAGSPNALPFSGTACD